MNKNQEVKTLLYIIAVFTLFFFLPVENETFRTAIIAMLDLSKWYAQEHVILCLLPAFFIAGVIAVFISQASVIRYFGANAKKWIAYSIASISGTILAVCSCTILPLFSSIHKRGAGLGPAIAFLYSGPAISILSIILTVRILGVEMGIARMIFAISFAIIIGLIMSRIYKKEELAMKEEQMILMDPPPKRPLWQTATLFFTLILLLIFINWGAPIETDISLWGFIYDKKWFIVVFLGLLLSLSLVKILHIKKTWVGLGILITAIATWLSLQYVNNPKLVPLIPILTAICVLSTLTLRDKNNTENKEWTLASWSFAKQILPLLAIGVLTAGFLVGSYHESTALHGVIPNEWIAWSVGGNSLLSNFLASVIGAFMYFATLTEVPIVQGLQASGMGDGPALALLLAGPSLSLPNLLVIRKVLGTKKTLIYLSLVILLSTGAGLLYGSFF